MPIVRVSWKIASFLGGSGEEGQLSIAGGAVQCLEGVAAV